MAKRVLTEDQKKILQELRDKHGAATPKFAAGSFCVIRRATRHELEALKDAFLAGMKAQPKGREAPSYASAQYALGVKAWVYPTEKEERALILKECPAFASEACDEAEALGNAGIEDVDLEGN